ncbi:MAG TPA: glycoside hydrolase family 6 protein [Candidatus Saccharimonadales bacterium]
MSSFKPVIAEMKQRKALSLLSICGALAVVVCGIAIFSMIDSTATSGPGKIFSSFKHTPNPLKDKQLYVYPDSPAAKQAAAWRTERPVQAAIMDTMAAIPTARWVGDDERFEDLAIQLDKVRQENKLALTVLYDIPGRDCGLYSAGGAKDAVAYQQFVDRFAEAIGETQTIVIVEPDAIPQMDETDDRGRPCLDAKEREVRTGLLDYAVGKLKALPHTYVYLDAGNSSWDLDPEQVVAYLKDSGIGKADGFSLNVSNFRSTKESTEHGVKLSKMLDDAHFVIDTSRNGNGPYDNKKRPDFNWCNPPGRALGQYPTFNTGHPLVDALLHIKIPGESDGQDPDPLKCSGGPAAGEWWPEYALGLVERWPAGLRN